MESLKILGISGSPRKKGNSNYLLEIALEAAENIAPKMVKTELYSISGKTFNPCDSCNQCHDQLGYCRQTDDDFGELRDKWIEADAIIYSVPVYHMGIPGQLKIFIDRLGNSWVESFTSRPLKVIGAIAQGSGLATGQETAMNFLNIHTVMSGCIPVGGDWPASYIGASGWTRVEEGKNALKKLHAEEDVDTVFTVDSIKVLSKNIVLTAMIVKAGGKALQGMLEEDGTYGIFLRRILDQN